MYNDTLALDKATSRAQLHNKVGMKYHSFDSSRISSLVRQTIVDLGLKLDSEKIGLKKPGKNAKSSAHRMEFRIDIGDQEIKPQIIIDNSFNGEGSLVFKYGIYRMVCSNGLMVGTDIGVPIVVRHLRGQKATTFETQFVEHCKQAINNLLVYVAEFRSKLQAIEIPRQEFFMQREQFLAHLRDSKIISLRQYDFANAARARNADAEGTAWGLFNSVQEAIVTRRNGTRNETGAALDRNDKLADIFTRYYSDKIAA